MPSILRNNSRFRRDQRQPPEEEEMWFNEEDDFEDVPADTKIAQDLDNSISKLYAQLREHFIVKLTKTFSGKIVDKKAELVNGPKSHLLLVTQTPNQQHLQQQQLSTQTLVNSTNNNISVSNNNRKSSETVTSSPEEHVEEPPVKIITEATNESPEVDVAKAAKALAAALDEDDETEVPLEELPQPDEAQPQLKPSSDTVNVDNSSSGSEIAAQSDEPVLDAAKSEEDSLGVKKVSLPAQECLFGDL